MKFKLERAPSAEELAQVFKETFDRSFVTRVEQDGKGKTLAIEAERRDSGGDYLTVSDLAALLQTDRKTVRRLTKARAQRSMRHPLPFFKINGKMLRFSRAKIAAWMETLAGEKPVLALGEGKRKRAA